MTLILSQSGQSGHFVSGTCRGEKCRLCASPATHKIGEEIAADDPNQMRHNLTAYVCCEHFSLLVGSAAPCPPSAKTVLCRYCPNLDHWVPVGITVNRVECHYCTVCPMYIHRSDFGACAEHTEHGGIKSDSPIIRCIECPTCSGIIPTDAEVTQCRFCDSCKAYVPGILWEDHRSTCSDNESDHPFGHVSKEATR